MDDEFYEITNDEKLPLETETEEILDDCESISTDDNNLEEVEIFEENDNPDNVEVLEETNNLDELEIKEEPDLDENIDDLKELEEIIDDTDIVESENVDSNVNVGNTEQINESNDALYNSIKYENTSEYYGAHNYSENDYDTYSQDPEWRRLIKIENPDYELPPLTQDTIDNILSPYEGKTYNSTPEYYGAHNFSEGDFEVYSQDPEWRRLIKLENPDYQLPPLSQEKIDSILAKYEGETYNSIPEYYGAHNFSEADFEIYSQDPEWRRLIKLENPDYQLPPMNNTDKINDFKNVDVWLKEINPNFDPYDVDSPYCNNCGSCAYAVYRRLEGDNGIVATADNIGYNDEMNSITGMKQVSMSPSEIETRLLEQGDGAHAIIGIDRDEGPGHWFNAVCKDGKVYAVDGQTGEINEWPPDYGNVVNWDMSIKEDNK